MPVSLNKAVVVALLPAAAAVARTGSFSAQPFSANPIMQFEDFNFYGEGIAYDTARDRVLMGTLSNPESTVAGKIYAVPYVNPSLYGNDDDDAKVVYTEDDMTVIFAGDAQIPAIVGLEMDPTNPDVVWAASSYYPPGADTPCGIAKIDISSGDLLQYYDLTDYRSTSTASGACLPNDIVFDGDGNLYATDFYGYQVWKIDTSDDTVSVVSADANFLCNENSGTCPPETQDLYSSNGPNGIEYVDGSLIVAVSSDRLVLIDLANTSNPTIITPFPEDGIQGCDGIIFDAAKEKLYIAGYGTEGSVQVATSTDGWNSMTVQAAFSASCVNDGTTTLAIAGNSDVLAFCSNNFGTAPYAISVLSGVVSNSRFALSSSSNFATSALFPEGIEYDANLNKLVVGSMGSGDISGLAPSLSGATYSGDSIYTYSSGDATVYGTSGLHIDREDETGCSMYACVGNALGDTSVAGGLAHYNLCTGERLNYISFESVMKNGQQFINDVIIKDSKLAYVTDYSSKDLLVVNKPYDAASTPEIFVEDICVLPNGIELYDDDFLLVGCADGIYRVDTDNKNVIKVSDVSNAVSYVDGLFFDDDEEILYAVLMNDRIVALSSDDDWETLDVLYIFTAGCANGMPATVTMADQTLFAVCLGADAGPYEVRYLAAVNEVVTDGNDVYGVSSEDGDDDGSRDDKLIKNLRIAVIVLSSLCGVFLVLLAGSTSAMHNMHKAREAAKREQHATEGVSMNPMAGGGNSDL